LEKERFMEDIHRAKFKEPPVNYQALEPAQLPELNQDPTRSPMFPKQENGIRNACALPYELYTNGRFDYTSNRYTIRFEAANKAFGKRAAGAPFLVYAIHPYKHEIGRTWDYAVLPGDVLEDDWQLNDFEGGRYHLRVYGP